MKFGLKDADFAFLDQNLVQPLKHQGLKIYVFGSRATGRHHPFSDIDVLLEGELTEEAESRITRIKELFEESNFPYKVDLVKAADLAQSYRPGVMRDRIEI